VKTKNCPICGAGKVKKSVATETFQYRGERLTIPDYMTYKCAECGEVVVGSVSLKESGGKLKDFKREVDSRKPIDDASGNRIVK